MAVLKTKRISSIEQRTRRVRAKIASSNRPRLSVSRSNKYISAQLIDGGMTKCASTSKTFNLSGVTGAQAVGKDIAQKAIALGITDVVFDRGQLSYEGNTKALADSAREAGLNF